MDQGHSSILNLLENLQSSFMHSSQLRIEMTANDGVIMVKTEVKKQDVASVKWNGPRTAEGKQRIAQAQLKHGAYAKANLQAKHAEAIQLRQLEDIAYLTGLIQGPRTRGAKPRGYTAITTMKAVKALVALE
jgi:hypothetical protein